MYVVKVINIFAIESFLRPNNYKLLSFSAKSTVDNLKVVLQIWKTFEIINKFTDAFTWS